LLRENSCKWGDNHKHLYGNQNKVELKNRGEKFQLSYLLYFKGLLSLNLIQLNYTLFFTFPNILPLIFHLFLDKK